MSTSRSRGGRPPAADPEALRALLLQVIEQRGYDNVSTAQLAQTAGLSTRTLHRYFPAKADIVWGGFDTSVDALREGLLEVPSDIAIPLAISSVVSSLLEHGVDDLTVLRSRLRLIVRSPALRSIRADTFSTWRAELISFIARRRGERPTELLPVALGSAAHEAIMVALGWWAASDDERPPAECIARVFESLPQVHESVSGHAG